MKKTLLLGMLLCGATMTFAQQNEPVYTERLDSVVSNDGCVERYEYKANGNYTQTTYGSDNERRICEFTADGKVLSYTSQIMEKDGSIHVYSKNERTYDSDGRKVTEKDYWAYSDETVLTLRQDFTYRYDVDGYKTFVTADYYDKGISSSHAERGYDANDSLVYEMEYLYKDSEYVPVRKSESTFSESGKRLSETESRYFDGEWVNSMLAKYNEGIIQEKYVYDLDEKGNVNSEVYSQYDSHGNMTKMTSPFQDDQLWKYEYDAEGRLVEGIQYCVESGEEIALKRKEYKYYTLNDCLPYYVVTEYECSLFDVVLSKKIYYPLTINDGVVSRYGTDPYLSYLGDYCPLSHNDRWTCLLRLFEENGDLVCNFKIDYEYNENGDILYEDFYNRNSNELEFYARHSYVYDENVPGTSIAGYSRKFKLLYETVVDASGKETSRTTYHYSPYSTTGITSVASSSDKAQAIYNLNGQKVSSTQPGQIYIQNGKKFIAK